MTVTRKVMTGAVAMFAAATASISISAQSLDTLSVSGFTYLTIAPGWSLVANRLSCTNNRVSHLFAAAPNDVTVYKFDAQTGGYRFTEKIDGVWEGDELNLSPGEGAFVENRSGRPFSVILSGQIFLRATNVLTSGFSIVSLSLPLRDMSRFPAQTGDSIFQFDPDGGGYESATFLDGEWWPKAPTIGENEAFFLFTTTPRVWVRDFLAESH